MTKVLFQIRNFLICRARWFNRFLKTYYDRTENSITPTTYGKIYGGKKIKGKCREKKEVEMYRKGAC